MSRFTTEALRSVALVGHGASGKTSLAEALLFATGAVQNRGSVEKGSTVCDSDAQEKEAGHSLTSAVVNFDHEGIRVHRPLVVPEPLEQPRVHSVAEGAQHIPEKLRLDVRAKGPQVLPLLEGVQDPSLRPAHGLKRGPAAQRRPSRRVDQASDHLDRLQVRRGEIRGRNGVGRRTCPRLNTQPAG